MQLSDLQNEWLEDSELDLMDLAEAAAAVPKLHAKYVTKLSKARLSFRKAESEYYRLRRTKERYFKGELTKDELDANGWDQYQYNKPLKAEMEQIINADLDVITAMDKVEYWRTVLVFLEQVMKSINSRTWDVKNAIEWKKLTMGG